MWWTISEVAAIPVMLFLLFGMEPFLKWLIKYQEAHPSKKARIQDPNIAPSEWLRTKR